MNHQEHDRSSSGPLSPPTSTRDLTAAPRLLRCPWRIDNRAAHTPERTRHRACFSPAHIGIVVRSRPRDEDTRGVQPVDTSRDTDSPPNRRHTLVTPRSAFDTAHDSEAASDRH
jgi:hypothetical protein